MKKLLVATTIALCLTHAFTPSAHASTENNSYKQTTKEKTNEMVGFGSGAVTGALIGGPVGAVIGGIFGLIVADDINGDAQLSATKQSLAQATYSLEQQQNSIIALQTDLQTMQHQQMVQLASFDQQSDTQWLNELGDFETNLQFKTASFLIEDVYTSQLNSLASILASYPQLTVKVAGFADERGDSSYNKILSKKRAEAVKQFLIDNNVNSNQIDISGEGETAQSSTTTNVESLFFDRKVNIRLIKPNQQMTAAN
jgi:peptidoglycan-associated lipoprotein